MKKLSEIVSKETHAEIIKFLIKHGAIRKEVTKCTNECGECGEEYTEIKLI